MSEAIRPNYYRPVRAHPRIAADADVIDIAQAFDIDFESGLAIKYLVRAGRKEGESAGKDLRKAIEVLGRRLEAVERAGVHAA